MLLPPKILDIHHNIRFIQSCIFIHNTTQLIFNVFNFLIFKDIGGLNNHGNL